MRAEVAATLAGMSIALQHAAYVAGGAIAVFVVICFVSYWLVFRR